MSARTHGQLMHDSIVGAYGARGDYTLVEGTIQRIWLAGRCSATVLDRGNRHKGHICPFAALPGQPFCGIHKRAQLRKGGN